MDVQTFWERFKFKAKEVLTSAKFWVLVMALAGVGAGYATGTTPPDEALKLALGALFTYAGLKVTDDALTRRA